MTVGEIISTIRRSIVDYNSDRKFTDSYLWSIYSSAAAKYFENKLSKLNFPVWSVQTFVMALEKGYSHDEGCLKVGCHILKTKHKIPRPVDTKINNGVSVYTIGGKKLSFRTEEQIATDLLDDIKKKFPSWGLINDKIVIWNNTEFKAIKVAGIWENIVDWSDKQYCGDNTDNCVDIYSMESGISYADNESILKMAINLLQIGLQKPEDLSTDRNTNLR